MFPSRLAALAAGVGWAAAQSSGWQANQVNATMCYWEQLRASVVRDTVYLDGGHLWWLPGLQDGSYGSVTSDGNPLGLIYTLNFSVPFNKTQNITALMGTLSKAPNGGAANNIAPNYFDGAMLANDDEFFLYGGLLQLTDANSPPDADNVLAYEAFQYGAQKDGFRPGFKYDDLPQDITRYVAYGGAANAPSENKAWYFSGLRSPSWGPIYEPGINQSLTAINVSDTLLVLDMSTQLNEKWSNKTLPSFIHGRANPELVWVPIGAQGILVAIGGVVDPEFVTATHKSLNAPESQAQSPGFMSTIDVYDIAGDQWYQQSTSGGPGQLTRGCAVVSPAQDYSSFNIYYYGGYDGLHPTSGFSDDVWILSLPSFMWMKVASGKGNGRAGHKCVMPYPDQMMVIGGYNSLSGSGPTCVDNGIVRVFNVTSGNWLDGYDPAKYAKYGVPEMIYDMIGGSETGGATLTTPSPTGWATPGLQQVFATPYPTSKLTTYYPYGSLAAGNNTNPNYSGGGSSTPVYLAPVLGSVIGLTVLTAVVVGVLLWRRRRLLRMKDGSEAGTDSRGRVLSWIWGQPTDAKAPTVTTEETPVSPDMESVSRGPLSPVVHVHHEMADTQVAELMDTSPRAELQDTGLTPVDIINKHSHFAQNGGSALHDPYSFSSASQTDHISSVSHSTGPRGEHYLSPAAAAPLSPPSEHHRPDSPSLGASPLSASDLPSPADSTERPHTPRNTSGVSGVSDGDAARLRHMSGTTVSSVHSPRQLQQQQQQPSPDSGGGQQRGRGADSSASPSRRSYFMESREDLDDRL